MLTRWPGPGNGLQNLTPGPFPKREGVARFRANPGRQRRVDVNTTGGIRRR
jgi:hypothetical protein